MSYQLLAAKGKLAQASAGSLATYAVKQARCGRHVGGSQDAARDAMSPAAQARHRFRTTSYDLYDRDAGQWRQMVIEDRGAAVPDLAAFRIDFADWLTTLTARDRGIISALAAGDGTLRVAGRFNVSPARVSQLRRRYERDWRAFHGEASDEKGGTSAGPAHALGKA